MSKERIGGKGQRRASAEDAPRLPALSSSLEDVAESVGLFLAGKMSPHVRDPAKTFAAIADVFNVLRTPIVRQLQEYLSSIEGQSFGSFEANHEFVTSLNGILRRLNLRVECTSCHAPATLLLLKGDTRNGAFDFRHTSAEAGRTTHGGRTTIPSLKLIDSDR